MNGIDIKYLKGVGDVRAKLLASEAGIQTLEDLLYYFPTRYVDRSRIYKISELGDAMTQLLVRGRFVRFVIEGEGKKKRLTGLFTDGKGRLDVVWFANVDYYHSKYKIGREYVLFGRPVNYRGTWQLSHPEIEEYDAANPPSGMMAIYPLTEGLRKKSISSQVFRKLCQAALEHPSFEKIEENLPLEVIERYRLVSLPEALKTLHSPTDQHSLERARLRMKFEELFYLELNILRFARERSEQTEGYMLPKVGINFNRFYSDVLPFELTSAQKRVIKEIRNDMLHGKQMNRLLQGDVGSGKTMVAFMTMLLAVDNGMQGCIMAPTEILATQHFESISEWCEKLGLKAALLTGSTRTSARRQIHAGLLDGTLNILVGTHALLENSVNFKKLGIAIIDEQHRFGVAQRANLWKKGRIAPHVLVMTATPIPRTLAMTVYGDLKVSVIDELPPGRKPVETHLFFEEQRMTVYRLIQSQIEEGRQAYIVYPLIKENDRIELKSVEKGIERLRTIFPGVEICTVHGRMKAEEKDIQMQLFVDRKAKIMVATTVIEVGVNVPNATLMLIENAERFGLSQLHQLRGRVGRGADRSYCILMSKQSIGGDTAKRLRIMTETTDGFLISEADMQLRGPGDMEGTQQSGLAFNLRMANLTRDGQVLALAREAAERVLESYPELYATDITKRSWTSGSDQRSRTVSLMVRELVKRFSKEIDWSRIS